MSWKEKEKEIAKMAKLWGMSTIKSDYTLKFFAIPGISFSKEKKFSNPLEDKYKTKAMFY